MAVSVLPSMPQAKKLAVLSASAPSDRCTVSQILIQPARTTSRAGAVVPLSDWSWRLVYLWGSLGVLLVLFARHLRESPRRLESRGEHAKADAVLREIEASVAAEKGPLPEPAPPVDETPPAKAPLRLLLQKKYLYPTLLLTVLWMTQTIGFFGYSSWAPTLLAKEGSSVEKSVFYVALTTVGAPLGCDLASLVTDRFERKWRLVVFGSVIAVCGLLYGLTFNPVLILVFGFLVNLFERGYTALAYTYSPELFDTRGRSLGTSVSYGLGRLSNAAGPLIVAALTPATAIGASSTSSPAPGWSARSPWPSSAP